MFSLAVSPNEFRALLPEAIWLETHHFEQARELSHAFSSEAEQWQTYVNALAFLGFTQWLNEKMSEPASRSELSSLAPSAANFMEGVCQLRMGEFKLCLIAAEHVLDEVIQLPQRAISNPDLAAHFYIAIEVCQEEEQIILRGVLRYDQLTQYLSQTDGPLTTEGCHPIPLSYFDPEPNHLLSYCRYLDAIAILLPAPAIKTVAAPSISTELRESLQKTKTFLSQWFQDSVKEGWLAIETLIHPEAYLALNTRNSEASIRKGKLLNLGVRLGQQTVALLVTINPEPEEKLNVLVQLHPTGGQRFLPPDIKLTLRSKGGDPLQEVQARGQDNYIQLQPFKGSVGKCFSLEVSLLGGSVKEDFEL
jgi:Protein of unknown function (DUF1822)